MPAGRGPDDPYLRHVKPDLGPRMRALGLDVEYHRGEGDLLYTRDLDGRERAVLDLVGGYGASLFGHAHPEIVAAVRAVLDEAPPFLAQGSRRGDAARLAAGLTALLRERTGRDYVAVFSSTGTAAVELALLHAHLEHRRRGTAPDVLPAVLVLDGGFHGVAIQAMRKRGFPGPEILAVPRDDPRALRRAFDEHGPRLMAVLVETIQGEGGVRPVPTALLRAVERLCRAHDVPLIVDEVQTGMGRTGALLDSLNVGITGDIVALAKALGGGLTKIGLTLIARERWVEGFDGWSTSTFAEDPFSARAALATLELLTRDDDAVMRSVVERGARFRAQLEALRRRHPTVVRDVRGRGLMLGLELQPLDDNPSPALARIADSGHLGYFLASAMLHQERIRVMPPVSSPRVLRLQPSYRISDEAMQRVVEALDRLCTAIGRGDCATLCRHLLGVPPDDPRDWTPRRFERPMLHEPIPPGLPRVAFLGHFIRASDLPLWDPSFDRFTEAELERFFSRFARFLPPRVSRTFVVRSAGGAEVGFVFVGFPQTARQYEDAWRSGDLEWIRASLREGLDVARAAGCSVVGFGGYTSIVLDNLRAIDAPDLALTTGNAYTVAAGIDALEERARRRGIDVGAATLGVVGALGNIASVYAQIMAGRVGGLVLVGRTGTERRLARLRDERIPPALHHRVEITSDLGRLRACELILTATNATRPVLTAEHVDPDRDVVICDISVPEDCGPDVLALPRCEVIRGGLVHVDGNEHVSFPGVPLPTGQLYACMAETALMGLEGIDRDLSRGAIDAAQVEAVRELATRHGIGFAAPMRLKPM